MYKSSSIYKTRGHIYELLNNKIRLEIMFTKNT